MSPQKKVMKVFPRRIMRQKYQKNYGEYLITLIYQLKQDKERYLNLSCIHQEEKTIHINANSSRSHSNHPSIAKIKKQESFRNFRFLKGFMPKYNHDIMRVSAPLFIEEVLNFLYNKILISQAKKPLIQPMEGQKALFYN